MKYQAKLVNSQGCEFDNGKFNSVSSAKKWAKGRGGKYKLVIIDGENRVEYNVK